MQPSPPIEYFKRDEVRAMCGPKFCSMHITREIDQRRREFFLEGQHLGDAIRFNAALNPAAGTAYPGGGTYGTQVCLPLPDVEKNNNPNF